MTNLQNTAEMCPVCGYTSNFAFAAKYHAVQRCCNYQCQHLFAARTPVNQGVMSPESDVTMDYAVYQKRNEHLIRYWRHKGLLHAGCRLLDFGAGAGHIVKSLKENMSVEVTCVEAGKEFHPRLVDIGCRVFSSLEEMLGTERFDAAILIEVVEHLDRPVEVLREIRNRLKKGGKLFLSTPAGDLRRPLREPWTLDSYTSPHHIQFFTPRSLTLAFKRAGFHHAHYRYVNEMYPDNDMRASDYESFWAKRLAIRRQIEFWREGCRHLTFFAY